MLTQRLETRAGLVQKRQADADKENQPANCAPEPCEENTDKEESTKRYNRKEKSLKKLCKDFVALYSASTHADICLDTAAEQLGVERRRIYDIINVLESVQVVERRAKNKYAWCGLEVLQTSIPKLRIEAQSSQEESSTTSRGSRRESRKDKSLGITCRKFLHLFLHGELNAAQFEECTLSLDEAAEILIAQEGEANNKLKTKIRRLYDIANILASIQLIEKVQTKSRKPSFKWIYQLRAEENKTTVTDVNTSVASSAVQSLPVKKRRDALKELGKERPVTSVPSPSVSQVPVSVSPVGVSSVTPRAGLTFTFNSPPRRVSPRLNPQSPSKSDSAAMSPHSSSVLTLLSQQPQEVQTQMWHSINQLVLQQLGDKRKLELSTDEHVSKRARIEKSDDQKQLLGDQSTHNTNHTHVTNTHS